MLSMSFNYKTLCASIAIATLSASCGQARTPTLIVQRNAIKVDGKLCDWKGIDFTSVTPTSGVNDATTPPPDSAEDLSFRFAVAYDDEAFYVAVETTDDQVVADSCEPGSISAPAWDDDAVEIFIDGNNNRAPNSRLADGSELRFGGEFSLIANGAAMSDFSGYPNSFGKLWSGATNYASVTNGTAPRMIYEFRITWAAMGLQARPEKIGFNLSVQDDDDGGRRDHALYWVGNPERPFSDESAFGTLHFNDNPSFSTP